MRLPYNRRDRHKFLTRGLYAEAFVGLAILMPTRLGRPSSPSLRVGSTPEVDLGYETLGTPGAEIPIIAVNGGPGLSHAYMMQNDLWQRVAAHRLVILYDQRGTGASKHLQPGCAAEHGGAGR